jgi:signal peptidase I
MKKIAIVLISIIIGSFVLVLIGKISGGLLFYKIPTPANEPTIKVGELLFTTNLKKAKVGDFVTYTDVKIDSALLATQTIEHAGNHYIHRLVGVEGDIITMKNGVLYLNETNFDSKLNLKHYYKISNADFNLLPNRLTDELQNDNLTNYDLLQTDSAIYANLTTTEIKEIKFSVAPVLSNPYPSTDIFKWHTANNNWTNNDFGPIKIPKDCGFIMGDNRDNSFDSRYWGFIELQHIKGVKL